MTQILVTLNEDVTTQHVRKAIELLRGVVSTTVFKTKTETSPKTLRQQEYVNGSLTRAFDELKRAQRGARGRWFESSDPDQKGKRLIIARLEPLSFFYRSKRNAGG